MTPATWIAIVWLAGTLAMYWHLLRRIGELAELNCGCWRSELNLLAVVLNINAALYVLTVLVLAMCWPVLPLPWLMRYWHHRDALRCAICGGPMTSTTNPFGQERDDDE